MNLGEQLTIVERALQVLIRDWDRFFAGDLRVPPHDDCDRLGRRLRLLAESSAGSRVDRYRLEQLQHRFMTYSQNWERMLRDREEGRTRTVAHARRSGPEPSRRPTNDSAADTVDDNGLDTLYDQYVAAKEAHGLEVAVDRATFQSQLAEQRRKLQAKAGGEIRFEVLVEDGKVRLAARTKRARPSRE